MTFPLLNDLPSRNTTSPSNTCRANIKMFASVNTLAIGLFALTTSLTRAQGGPGFEKFHDFSKTCTNITLDGYGLSADCTPLDPSKPLVKNPVTVLDFCVGFNDITMKLAASIYGKLSRDCDKCILTADPGAILQCECEFWDTNEEKYAIKNVTGDLDTVFTNYDGTMSCVGTETESTPDDWTTTLAPTAFPTTFATSTTEISTQSK
ncbi:hypothetical protein QC762_504325 [Podospora pseudocomata]|uniref:Cyanovirin-N domain-containing protein n=1 Tax=Podospora pseudocomata TaxID=2093779 RepID=A0ABR0GB94_9PEZI|nr:hypothetical protein QC762_504325 [Podospora pseudocomata]